MHIARIGAVKNLEASTQMSPSEEARIVGQS